MITKFRRFKIIRWGTGDVAGFSVIDTYSSYGDHHVADDLTIEEAARLLMILEHDQRKREHASLEADPFWIVPPEQLAPVPW